MNRQQQTVMSQRAESVLATNAVLRNTMIMLALSFTVSAAAAFFALVTNAPPMNPFLTLLIYFGFLFVTNWFRNSPLGIVTVFGFTAFLGYTAGPIVNIYMSTLANGSEIVFTALGGTGIIFFALAGYVMTTRKDFSYMGGFLGAAMIAIFLAAIGNIFFAIPALSLGISALVVMVMSGFILYEMSDIIHGHETNYLMATVSIFLSLYNIFMNLLHILAALSGRSD